VSIDEVLAGVGHRVSVRRVVGSNEGRPLFGDVVGDLERAEGDQVVVRRRDGTRVAFPRASVVAARRVRARGLRLTGRELEEIAALGWRGTETEQLGGWLLRYGHGFTGRANSALLLGDPGEPLPDAVARVVAWYEARGLPPKFQVPLPDSATADAWLAEHGWASHDEVRVLVADLALILAAAAGAPAAAGNVGGGGGPAWHLRIDDRPDDAWLAAYHYRGGDLPPEARTVLENGDQLGFASVRASADATVLAIARGSVDRRWLGVTAVEVAPHARRQGLGGVILRGLARWATDLGAHSCYLQVAVENEPALALYLGSGFVDHHRYRYRVRTRPDQQEPAP
jgi:GNAT superfamily N-acetyltransferase